MRTYEAEASSRSVAWSPDGELFAACIGDNHLRVWNSADGQPVVRMNLTSIPGDDWSSAQLSWHPDGDQLAVCAPKAWCLIKRSDWMTIRKHDLEFGRGRDVAWSPDGQTLALADGEMVVLWEPSKEQPERTLRGHSGRILEVDWSPDGQQLVSSDDAGEVKIWDLTIPFSSPGFKIDGPVQTLSWRDDNQTLAVVHESDRASSFWNALSGKKLSVKPPISEGQVLWSPDRQRVACYGDGETTEIRVVDADRGEVHAIWRGVPGDKIAKLAWSPDGRMLAIGKFANSGISLTLWDVNRELSISTWLHHGPWVEKIQLVWSPEATHVAITALGETGDNGTPIWYGHVYVVNVVAGTTVLKHTMPHRADVSAVAWKPDGRAFVAGTTDGLIEAVDVESGQTLFSTGLHSTTVNSLAWSPDGQRIVSAVDDGSIKLLAADDGGDLLIFPLGEKATHVAWSPAGNRLAAATGGGQVHVWDAARADALSEQGHRRGELAMAYDRGRPHESPAERAARVRQMLRLAPDTLEFWQALGEVRAALGDFQGATEEFAKAMSPGMRRSFESARAYGLSLLGTGRMDAYREHCVSMLNEFANTQVPSSGGHIAWLCALAPNQNLDTETLVGLARANVARNADDGQVLAMLQLGAALHRHGRYQEAADLLTAVVERVERVSDPTQRSVQADALYFLAMARHQLGHTFQARRYLDEAAQIAEQLLSPSWQTTLQHQVLEREARALIAE